MVDMIGFIVSIAVFLLLLVGVFQLQVFLSKKPSKWVGLVLPMICVCFSIIAILFMVSYSTITSTETTAKDGKVIEKVIENGADEPIDGALGNVIVGLLITNVPTLILLAIYAGCRSEMKKKNGNNKEIEKMNIMDLE